MGVDGEGGEGGEGRAPAEVEKGNNTDNSHKVEKGNNTYNANRGLDRVESHSLAVAIGSSIGSWVGGALMSAGGDKSHKGDTGDQEKAGTVEGTQAATESFGAEVVKFSKVIYYSV